MAVGGIGPRDAKESSDDSTRHQPLRTITSTTRGENLGFDTIGLGDVNGDGIPDRLVSAASGQPVYVIAATD